ncbi:hypothetical protein [Aurantibacillus circumpalustris]|uniref:hypothetical protein n=1 Tax=Aurantibacillus circumpalustris TaxID=3036359 RepID=UPI00295B0615|nr:hypothetical protein [Aurantibacillus circumpalustris]
MNQILKNFYALAIPLSLSVAVSLLLNTYTRIISENYLYSLSFFTLIGFILNIIYAQKAGTKIFTQLLLVAIVIKLLLGLTGVIVYSFIDKPGFFSFSIQFILHYILFTIFEIRYLLFLIKSHPIKRN